MSSPVAQTTIQACILTVIGNIIAQYLTTYRMKSVYIIDWTSVLHFVIYTALSQPPNFLWQQFLETKFPAETLQPSSSAIAAAASNDEKELDREQSTHEIAESRLNIGNTLLKFVVDQTFGAAINTALFSLAMAGLKGASWEQAVQIARQDFWGLVMAGWRLWPLVSAINYTFVRTVRMRALVGNLAGIGWTVYLGMVTR